MSRTRWILILDGVPHDIVWDGTAAALRQRTSARVLERVTLAAYGVLRDGGPA